MDLQSVINSLRDRGRKMVALDNPQDQDLYDIGADIGVGFVPGVGQVQAGRDFERARREKDKFGMGLAAFGMIPFVGGLRAVGKVGKAAKAAGKVNLQRDGVAVKDLMDAEKRWGDGEQIFAFHEMDEAPTRVTSLEMLNNYQPDQLLAVPKKAAAAPRAGKVENVAELVDTVPAVSSRAKAGAEQRMLTQAIDGADERVKYLRRPTVENPQRVAFPGIYKRPDELVAGARTAPEDPLMQRLFGVNRDDLFQIAEQGKRQGNMGGVPFRTAAKPRGAKHAGQVMTPQNEQRLLDILSEAEKRPDLYKGMAAWYTMDPAYQHFVRLYGPERAAAEYNRFNALTGMASPNSEVLTELNRGTGAFMLDTSGRFDDFKNFGGLAEDKRGLNYPADMRGIQGHMVHSTAQAGPMEKFLRAGRIDMDSPKVPSYIHASGVPETGFQTQYPVGDAHWSRLVGLPDVRGLVRDSKSGKMVPNAASASTPEMVSLGPWWRDNIAGKAGLESVPAQAVVWGAGSNATGVTSPIGAPKLELLSAQIGKAANRLGISPEDARDRIFLGKEHAGLADPALLGLLGAGTAGGLTVAALRNRKEEKKQ